MNIEKLQLLHLNEYLKSSPVNHVKEHTKISIEFAIGTLESLMIPGLINGKLIRNKIQELKQYLDESK